MNGDGRRLVELVDELRKQNAQLEFALSSRIVIEQAKGILAERYRLDLDTTFDVLRRAARRHRLRIHALAEAVVTSPRTPSAIELELVQGRAPSVSEPA